MGWGAKLIDALVPDNQIEYLRFTRISGDYFRLVLANQGNEVSADASAIMSVKLKVNPQTITYKQAKIISKVQTSSPGRFTVFDWGNELLQITISGCTGNLLPTEITSGFNPVKSLMNDLSMLDSDIAQNDFSKGLQTGIGAVAPIFQDIMIGSMTYYELLALSPKYRTFMKLQNLYKMSDADKDIITLETGETVHRGYFVDFSFTQTAENPWNWQYIITFTSLNDLSSFFNRSDVNFNDAFLITQ